MTKFILEFNNHIYIKYKPEHTYTIKDLYVNTIDTIYSNDFTKNINNYYFIKDNKLIHPDSNINYSNNTSNNTVNHIKCYRKQYGGILGNIKDAIEKVIDVIFKPIIDPIKVIGDVFTAIYKFLKWVGLFIYWTWFFAVWLFTDLLNPKNFIYDFFYTIQLIVMTIFSSIFSILLVLLKMSTNTVGGWVQGFWGWDQSSLTELDRNSNYFKNINKNNNKNKKCYLTNTNTVPFSIILGTVLCPPIGVFMDLGITGWYYIFICLILTLCFYLPGLIYALIIIYE